MIGVGYLFVIGAYSLAAYLFWPIKFETADTAFDDVKRMRLA